MYAFHCWSVAWPGILVADPGWAQPSCHHKHETIYLQFLQQSSGCLLHASISGVIQGHVYSNWWNAVLPLFASDLSASASAEVASKPRGITVVCQSVKSWFLDLSSNNTLAELMLCCLHNTYCLLGVVGAPSPGLAAAVSVCSSHPPKCRNY